MAQRKLEILLTGDDKSFSRTLDQGGTSVGRFENKLMSAGRRLRSFGSTAMRAGRSMTVGLTVPLVGWGALAFQELSEGAEAMGQTRAAIQSTGRAADRSAPQIARLAGRLSEISSIDDEDIQAALNVLLTFTEVSGDTFDRASMAIVNISTRMGTDLNSAALQVGKALNNPIRGLSSLTRIGVNFTDGQRQQIEAMVAFGNTAGAQRIILQELNREFGHSAEQFGRTPAARLRRLKQRFEELGASVLKNLMPVLNDMAEAVETLSNRFDELTPRQQKLVAWALVAAAVLGPLTTTIGALASATKFAATAVVVLGRGLAVLLSPLGLILAAIVALGYAIYLTITRWDELKLRAQVALDFIINKVPGVHSTLVALGQVVGVVRGAMERLIGVVRRLAGVSLGPISSAFNALASIVRGVVDMVLGLIDTIRAAANAINTLPNNIAGLLPGVVNQAPRSIGPGGKGPRPATALPRTRRGRGRTPVQPVLVVNGT